MTDSLLHTVAAPNRSRSLAESSPGLAEQLERTALAVLRRHGRLVERADPTGSVSVPSRLLCAGLAELAVGAYSAFGGEGRVEEVRDAAAMLSLLTKIDDQVIDDRTMHGGPETCRDEVERRVRAYLAPTLRSIRDGFPAEASPRCDLAAELGRRLHELSGGGDRHEALLDVVAAGWEVQVVAVRTLSAHPAAVSRAEVETITTQISGLWLEMITLVGTLPREVRAMSLDERAAFEGWGRWIQRADALSDFGKDREDGLRSSLPSWLLHHAGHHAGDAYAALADSEIDAALLPEPGALRTLQARHAALGTVPAILRWIHGFLTWRYLADERSARRVDAPTFARFIEDASGAGWERYLRALRAHASGAR